MNHKVHSVSKRLVITVYTSKIKRNDVDKTNKNITVEWMGRYGCCPRNYLKQLKLNPKYSISD